METPSIYDPAFTTRLQRMVRSRYGLWVLGVISFVESSLPLPIITDPFLMVYILANRAGTVKAVVVTIITSVLGGLAAFLAAYFFQALVFSFMAPDMAAQFHDLTSRFQDQTLALTVIGAVTPVPYTLVAIVAGFMKGNALVFVLASLVGRGIRYGVAGYVIYLFGPQAVAQVRKNLFIVSILTVLATAVYLFYRW